MQDKYKNIIILLFLLVFIQEMTAQPAYNYSKLKREKLNRGVVAVKKDANTNFISWRYLSSDPVNITFNVYRNGNKINDKPIIYSTCYEDKTVSTEAIVYTVKPLINGKETKDDGISSWTLPANAPEGYINIPLEIPPDGVTPAGHTYTYSPNDASIGDVDGDGEYEIILKWDPSNAHDNAHDGYTGNVYFDCYKLNGKKLWRIDLGRNIRAGAHYTQFMVYDLDGDGKAEIVMKTSDGTVDGLGKVIGDPTADYREAGDPSQPRGGDFPPNDPRSIAGDTQPPRNQGRILTGQEYLTVFNGETGAAMQTINYNPLRGNLKDWGDERANRSDRHLACIAYLDGEYPSVVMCRGYYTRTVLVAYDWRNGQLTPRWKFDSNMQGNEKYAGQGNHNLRVGDVDGDGCDEIIYGSCVIDNNGKGLYTTGLGHGDAMHLTVFDPTRKGMQVWDCHENKRDGSTFRDAATGEILFQIPSNIDVGRCMAADIDPNHPGVEMWSVASGGIRDVKGECIDSVMRGISVNMACWWDGDLLRELLDKNQITKYDYVNGGVKILLTADGCISNNGTKATPCIQGDIIGDWREEVLFRTVDNKNLRLYVSIYNTDYRFHSFAEDPIYRISMATQNVAYNQPTQPGFYFGPDLEKYSHLFRGYEFKNTVSQELFPDGTPIPDWFRDNKTTDINTLGKQYRVTDYGVATDSAIVQTEKIQAVIDKASQSGGGVIVIPKGTFLSGSLFFKPKTHLFLEENAVLKGSDDISNFPIVMTRIEGQTLKYFAALVNVDSVNGFTISGKGTIDGNGLRYWKSFWLRREFNPDCTNMDEMRPRLVYVSNSKDIQLSGVTLINSPFWTTHFYKCENVKMLNLTIFSPASPVKAPSTDAIDIDACTNMLVKNCNISVNDDAVALKGGKGPLADKDENNGGNRNIIIEDCTYGFCHSALTCGSESIYNRNIILRRCTINKAQRLLWLKMRLDTPQNYEYILVEDITGSVNSFLYVKSWTQFFDLKGQKEAPLSYSSHVTMRNIQLDCNIFFDVDNSDQYKLSDFTFENLDIKANNPEIFMDYINNFVLKNVVVNGTRH